MNDLSEEEKEEIEEGISDICEVLSNRYHYVLHSRLQINPTDVLACPVSLCEKCPFYNIDNFANWIKKPNIFDSLEEEKND